MAGDARRKIEFYFFRFVLEMVITKCFFIEHGPRILGIKDGVDLIPKGPQ